MQRSDGHRARCLNAKLWIAIALCSVMNAGCAGTLRPPWQDARPQAEVGVAASEPVGRASDLPTGGTAAPVPSLVVPTTHQEISEAPSPASEEFKFLSQPPQHDGMTLEEVLQHTLDNHPLLQARAHEVEAARGRLVTAGLLTNPQWVTDSETPVDEDGATILSTRLTFTLPTGRKRRWAIAAAEADVAKSRAALDLETELVLAEAADAAMEVLYLQELVVVQGELSQSANRTAEIVAGQFQAGTAEYVSVIKARLDAAEIESDRLAARGNLELARVRLNRAAGLSPVSLVQMRGRLVVEPVPALRMECLLAEAKRSRPDLAASHAALLESQRLHAQERAEARPDVVFGPRVQNNLGETGDRVGARFEIDLPLFDRNQGAIAESSAAIRTRRAMVDATEINTLHDVAAAYLELQDAQTRLDFHRTQVQPLVEQTESAIRSNAAAKVLAADQVSQLVERMARMRVELLELRYLHARLRTRLEILLGCALEDLPAAH